MWREKMSDRLGLTRNTTWEHPTLSNVYVMALTQGQTTQFNKDHYPILKQDTWCAAMNSTGGFYAARTLEISNQKRQQGMHRVLVEYVDGPRPSPKHDADHIAGSTTALNNIRAPPGGSVDTKLNNLRWYVNQRNTKLFSTNTSGVNGVNWDSRTDGWRAQWHQGGKQHDQPFYVRPKGDADESERQYRAAVAFRQARDLETGTTNGQRDV